MKYDVIIVGAGPAGSSAAYYLAAAGRKVLVLEKETFPRYKACAGGISIKALPLLDFDWQGVVEAKPRTLVFFYRSNQSFKVEWKEPMVYMVMRDRFDSLLADRAKKAGAEIKFGNPVEGVFIDPGSISVKTKTGFSYRASYVLGADGANSRVARSLNLLKNRRFGTAVAVEIQHDGGSGNHQEIRVDCGLVPKGICWQFPKTGQTSTGACTFRQGVNIYDGIDRFLTREGMEKNHLKKRPQAPGGWRERKRLTAYRAMLLGDAGGWWILTGEGIYYALKSGFLAARAIIEKNTPDQVTALYQESIFRELFPELHAASRLTALYYRLTGVCFKLVQINPRLARALCDAMCGNFTYQNLSNLLPVTSQSGANRNSFVLATNVVHH